MPKGAKQALLTIVLANGLLAMVLFLFPEEGIPLGRGQSLRFVTWADLSKVEEPPNTEKADSLLADYLDADTVESFEAEGVEASIYDSLAPLESKRFFAPDSALLDSLLKGARPPEYSSPYLMNPSVSKIKGDTGYNYALDNFFEQALLRSKNEVIRVFHYGDSQLEGDRLTRNLRGSLQQWFGGGGLGFVPIADVSDHLYFERETGKSWAKYSYFVDHYEGDRYGPSGMMFRLINPDSTKPRIGKSGTIEGRLTLKFHSSRLKKRFSRIRLLYAETKTPFRFEVRNGKDSLLKETLVPPVDSTTFLTVYDRLGAPVEDEYSFKITTPGDPSILGLYFETETGVQVDNYALRGHSGFGIRRMPTQWLRHQYELMNAELAIVQFGANAIPYIEDSADCAYQVGYYRKIIRKIKRAKPGISILVIGPGDMGEMVEGEPKSFEQVICMRDAQMKAALENGAAFYDLLEAMGGKGAIVAWSEKKLASLDGHLGPGGRRIIAREIMKALKSEFDWFLYRKKASLDKQQKKQATLDSLAKAKAKEDTLAQVPIQDTLKQEAEDLDTISSNETEEKDTLATPKDTTLSDE